MRIVQLTPGAGGMYCGNCLRDNALVASLRRQGHAVTMLPLYLPLKTDEADESAGAPVFFGGINVYLEQRAAFFRRLPRWAHDLLDSPRLLRWVGTRAAQTRPEQVGDLTLSMLRGEQGNQAREVDALVRWLADHERPDVICLSNALLVGMARRLKRELGALLTVTLQGEDAFVEALPERNRREAWAILAERLAEADLLIAPTRYYADRIAARTGLPASRIHLVPNGISLAGWRPAESPPSPPTLGYLARMCPEKGLDRLADSFVRLRKSERVPGLRLRIAGSCGPGDRAFVERVKSGLQAAGVLGEVEFLPNLDHAAKQEFLRSLSVFSVPAHYGEAFGLYLVEAMAAAVPVVQPDTGAFRELIEATGAGVVCAPDDPPALAAAIERVLLDPGLARRLGAAGRAAVEHRYNSDASARTLADLFATRLPPARPGPPVAAHA
jgi:glycosyltransferase involved in cell wall biosynthesis